MPKRSRRRQRRDYFWGFFIAFGLLVFVVAVVVGCAKKEIRNLDSRGANIICFGDSITFGYGVSPGEDYPTAFAKLTDIPVINSGIDGDTTSEALKRIEADVLERDPLLVIIEFAGNDFLRKIPQQETVTNISRMIDMAQAKGAMVAVVDISAGMFLADYRMAFRKLADEKDSIFISGILNGIITNPSLKSDFLHPNAKGYKIIAQKVYRDILPYLKQNKQLLEKKKEKVFIRQQ